jgi:peptidoglycan/LPS O-acetylase OafA/YrhL
MNQRIDSLDALRGILALAVFAGHAGALWLIAVNVDAWLVATLQGAARYAVVVFFVLSGFAIALSLHENMQRGFSIARYASARLIRVVPPLVTVLVLVWLLSTVVNAYGPGFGVEPFASRQQYQMSLIPALGRFGQVPIGVNSPLWSLQYEIQLYVIAGLGAWLFSTKDSNYRLLAMVLLIMFLFATGIAPPNKFHTRAPYFLAFALGAIGYVGRHCRTRILVVVAAAGAAAFALLASLGESPTGAVSGILLWRFKIVAVAALSVAAVIALSRNNVLSRLKSLGAWSFTLYIVHYPFVLGIDGLAMASAHPSAVWGVGAPSVLLMAYALGRLIERPKEQRQWLQTVRRPIGAVP